MIRQFFRVLLMTPAGLWALWQAGRVEIRRQRYWAKVDADKEAERKDRLSHPENYRGR